MTIIVDRRKKAVGRACQPLLSGPFEARRNLRARCLCTANRLSRGFEASTPPFPLQPLLDHFDVTYVRKRPLDRDACLKLDAGELVIEVNSLYSSVVQRFSIAHEVGHLVVSQCSRGERSGWERQDDEWIEGLCDQLAGRLLAPDWAIFKYLGNQVAQNDSHSCISKASLQRAAVKFAVPLRVMAMRLMRDLRLSCSFSFA